MSTILFTEQISEFSYIKVLIGFFNYCNVDFTIRCDCTNGHYYGTGRNRYCICALENYLFPF